MFFLSIVVGLRRVFPVRAFCRGVAERIREPAPKGFASRLRARLCVTGATPRLRGEQKRWPIAAHFRPVSVSRFIRLTSLLQCKKRAIKPGWAERIT